jgi:hypothetical protein
MSWLSKSAEDGFGKWGHDQVLGDVVRAIRPVRPEIIISRFTERRAMVTVIIKSRES